MSTSVVKWSEGLSTGCLSLLEDIQNKWSSPLIWLFRLARLLHILLVLLCIIVYMVYVLHASA